MEGDERGCEFFFFPNPGRATAFLSLSLPLTPLQTHPAKEAIPVPLGILFGVVAIILLIVPARPAARAAGVG